MSKQDEQLLDALKGTLRMIERTRIVFASRMPAYFSDELSRQRVHTLAAIELLKENQ